MSAWSIGKRECRLIEWNLIRLHILQTEVLKGDFILRRQFCIPAPVCWFSCLCTLFAVASFSIAPVCSHSENFHPLFWMNLSELSLQCVIHLLSEMLFARIQSRVMGCLGERSLSSSMLLQMAVIKDWTTTATWLWEPMRKFWSWLHLLIIRTLIHPLSCCKVEMLPQQLPSPTLFRSLRHRWMCVRILLQNDPLAYFILQSCYGVAVDSDSHLCGSYLMLMRMWTVTLFACVLADILRLVKALSSCIQCTLGKISLFFPFPNRNR